MKSPINLLEAKETQLPQPFLLRVDVSSEDRAHSCRLTLLPPVWCAANSDQKLQVLIKMCRVLCVPHTIGGKQFFPCRLIGVTRCCSTSRFPPVVVQLSIRFVHDFSSLFVLVSIVTLQKRQISDKQQGLLFCVAEKLLESAVGRRRNMWNVWRTELQSWKTRTKL